MVGDRLKGTEPHVTQPLPAQDSVDRRVGQAGNVSNVDLATLGVGLLDRL